MKAPLAPDMLPGDTGRTALAELHRRDGPVPAVPPRPTHLMVEPSSRCNLRCPLCPTGSGALKRPVPFIPRSTFEAAVDEFSSLGGRKLSAWAYGEPFLHREIFDLLRYASDQRLDVRTSTGGFLFARPDGIRGVLTSGLSRLIVSVDGMSRETLSKYRVGIDHDQVMRGLHELMEERRRTGSRLLVEFQFILMRHNQHEVEAARRMAASLGCVFVLKTANLSMVDGASAQQWLPDDKERCRYECDSDGHVGLRDAMVGASWCPFAWSTLVLNSDGSVVPCIHDYYSEYVVGRFPEQSLLEIWQGSRMQSLRKRFPPGGRLLPMCIRCPAGMMDTPYYKVRSQPY